MCHIHDPSFESCFHKHEYIKELNKLYNQIDRIEAGRRNKGCSYTKKKMLLTVTEKLSLRETPELLLAYFILKILLLLFTFQFHIWICYLLDAVFRPYWWLPSDRPTALGGLLQCNVPRYKETFWSNYELALSRIWECRGSAAEKLLIKVHFQ